MYFLLEEHLITATCIPVVSKFPFLSDLIFQKSYNLQVARPFYQPV